MTSRLSTWRHATDPEALAFERKWEADRDFWEYVDSQSFGGYRHRHSEEAWATQRSLDCLALNSRGERCTQTPLGRVPFCDFHFDRAWTRIEAFVADERLARVNRMAELDHSIIMREAKLDVAMVRDAKRALALQQERVYFFAADHAMKIGRSINPERRVRTLGSTKAPEGIDIAAGELLGMIPGGCNVESEMHRRFARHRLVGEWFDLGPIRSEIADLIEQSAVDLKESA